MQITAHSGSEGTPDNSWEFIDRFLDSSVDCFELDVRQGKDNRLYLGHDGLETTGSIPLAEVFDKLSHHPRIKLNCDLKESGLERLVQNLGEEYGVLDRLQYSGTLMPEAFGDSSKTSVMYNPENLIPDFYASNKYRGLEAWQRLATYCAKNSVAALNVNYRILDDASISTLGKAGVCLSVWTVDDPESQRRFAHMEVFNITTRRPSSLLEATQC